ncbi:MAG: type II toxin-antitoxin system RelE/ParE family toxin [Kiritimatiellae bacterium]|nr:type II toxin-antitoxin system RelE/ParE family toxin [Kiritimatiellia bacterium]
MVLWKIREAEYGIFAIGDKSECAVADFLVKLANDDMAEFAKIQARIDQTSHNGPPHNKEQCNTLGNGNFELKTKRVRIACFWDEGRLIICSHAFLKKGQKTPKCELKRLEANKKAYLQAKDNGDIRYETQMH